VTAGEFDQRFDALFYRRMGIEEVGSVLTRIIDTHLHDRRIGAAEVAAALNFTQRHDHGVGIFLVSSTAPASARYSRERDRAKRIMIESDHASAIRIAKLAPPDPRLSSLLRRPPPKASLDWKKRRTVSSAKRDHAGNNTITKSRTSPLRNVCEFMPQHRFDFGSIKPVQQAARHGDRKLFLVKAGCKGVKALTIHHLELRHGEATGNAEVF
jgi:hypothetical protein